MSPDGRFWWNGAQWVPVQQAPAYGGPGAPAYGQPGPPAKRGLSTGVKVLIGVLSALVLGMVGLFFVGVLVDDGYSNLTCQELAKKAVAISDTGKPIVLKGVRDLTVVEDHRDSYSTPASGENTILSCRGTADWNTIDDSPVLVKMTVDSDGKTWVKYEMTS
jgi:hypothetical protein